MSYTRAQYMDGEVSHADYYGQFVTPEIKSMVEEKLGYGLRNYQHDEHLNDIQLPIWDRMAYSIKLDGCDNSLSSKVCTLKQAAKQLIAESKS